MENKVLMVILAILIPPLAVGLKEGIGVHLLLNIVLCFVFVIPAVIHAIWLVLR